MVEETRPEGDGQLRNPSVRSEKSDASFGWVLGLIIAAAVLGLVLFVVVWAFLRTSQRAADVARRSPFPLAPAPSRSLPPEPRLEQVDRLARIETPNVYERQLSKEEVLAGFGPTEDKGFVHIPIEKAMRLLPPTGKLKSRPAPAGPQERQNGLVDAGESNSGRLLRKEPKWSER